MKFNSKDNEKLVKVLFLPRPKDLNRRAIRFAGKKFVTSDELKINHRDNGKPRMIHLRLVAEEC